ncbi:trypsin-like serine protease, partial [Kitasatospora sp. NPDC097691]|uniref:trypsin-like serine protease n=1 Tax=Kitasatospora sp. NPDC097691 TaxID=3157231 RepID=UPI00332B30F7
RPLTVLLAAAALVAAAAAPAAAVHGGSDTTTTSHPFAVALQTAAGEQWCTGALIAPPKVLTAGHCVAEADDPRSLRVIAGRTDLTGTAGQVRRVKAYRVDPRHTTGLDHDAAGLPAYLRSPAHQRMTHPSPQLRKVRAVLSALVNIEQRTRPAPPGVLNICRPGS